MQNKQNKAGLIIFIKNPELGKVKTRLAATIGDEAALAVYRKLLEHTKSCAILAETNNYLFYDQSVINSDNWSTADFSKLVQSSGDLGSRMNTAFTTVLRTESKAVIIGSDCPELQPSQINDALARLDVADIVLGPTLDGGYYLLGMKEEQPFLFEDMPWSTEEVLATTIIRIQAKGLLYSLLPTLSDLDNIDDLKKFPEFSQ